MRVALYCRVSTDEQKQGKTIEAQIKELEEVARARSYTVVRRYVDNGWSGSLISRPALDAMRDDAEQRLFDAVLINDVDRLSRDIANLAVIKRSLERNGVEVVFKNVPNDKSPMSNFMINILGSFAEFERAMIADRTRRGRRYKVQERKIIMGNLPPYGYRYLKKDKQRGVEGRYEIHQEEARVVQMIYAWVVEDGLSARATLRRLNELSIPPRKGRRWARSSLHRILANETYTGTTFYNRHRTSQCGDGDATTSSYRSRQRVESRLRDRADWIPIPLPNHLHLISRDTFDRAQEQLRRNRAFSSRNVKHFYLLREVRKVCARCGGAYVGSPSHGRTYYRCANRDGTSVLRNGDRCRSKILTASIIEPAVWEVIAAAVQNPSLIISQVEKILERRVALQTRREAELGNIERDLATVQREEERVLAAYRTSVINLPQLEKEIATINRRRAALEELRSTVGTPPSAISPATVSHDVVHWTRVVRKRLASFQDAERQRFLGHLLTEIVIDGDTVKIRGNVPSEFVQIGSAADGTRPRSVGNIESTTSYERGHNPTYPFEFILSLAA